MEKIRKFKNWQTIHCNVSMEPLESNQTQKTYVLPSRISVRWPKLPSFPRKENAIVTPIILWWCPCILSENHRNLLRLFGHSYRYNRKTFKFDFVSKVVLPIPSKLAHWSASRVHPFDFICSGQNLFDFCQIRASYSPSLMRPRNQDRIAPRCSHRRHTVKACSHARSKLWDYLPRSSVAITRHNWPQE